MNFVFDLDGTICFDGMSIPNVITETLQNEIIDNPDHQLFFASARPVRDMLPLFSDSLREETLIGCNGGMIFSEQKCTQLNGLLPEDFQKIKEYIMDEQLDYLIDTEWDYAFHGNTLGHLKERIDREKRAKNCHLETITHPVKALIGNFSNEKKIREEFSELSIDIIQHAGERCIDLNRKGVNKYSTLQQVINDQEYVAFGNDWNDQELLSYATYSVGVGDSQAVQESANEIITANPRKIAAQIKKLARA